MEEQKISRQSLYHDDSGSESESESEGVSYMPPNLEFEFVEVENYASAEPKEATQEDNHEEEEFAFPLFASTTAKEETESKDTDGNDRGRSKIVQPIQKISLREHSEERIDNERPESYYFASYTPEEKSQFAQVAVSANDIYSQYFIQPNSRKLINLNEYNASIEKEQQKAKAKKARNRPGKKKRQSKILCRERRLQRAAIAKKEEKERKLKEKQEKYGKFKRQGGRHMKKTFGKAGPGRNKSAGGKFVGGKPKYRTE
ncbi:hypothetical protein CORT_0A04450 [Candida orthopsilosis Co 90-125]|uniref:Uncharacterized protein n=1 Tax=Candida orthopsilosis (strain 90-125) TaxID=1136231 RepID=H8WWK9_CANO9|nr:hypothetical protein CORT_0A04450 [Candida orthopsilosis Co 90-125]CCG20833.1 hypothetical protein CORT_0A04450 [Candida orthopsilosis Co 90-125]